ncbi:unnamed protein product, partial [Allacma fusca]
MPTASHTNIWGAGLPPSLPTITKEIFKYLNKPDDATKNTNEFRNNTPGTSKDFPKRKIAVSNWNWDMGDGPKHHPVHDVPEVRNGFSFIREGFPSTAKILMINAEYNLPDIDPLETLEDALVFEAMVYINPENSANTFSMNLDLRGGTPEMEETISWSRYRDTHGRT